RCADAQRHDGNGRDSERRVSGEQAKAEVQVTAKCHGPGAVQVPYQGPARAVSQLASIDMTGVSGCGIKLFARGFGNLTGMMSRRFPAIRIVPAVLTGVAAVALWTPLGAQSGYQPASANLAAREWFQDARFGMFIH